MGDFRLSLVSEADYAAWFEHHYDMLPQRTPFHHPAWLRVVRLGSDHDVAVIGIQQGSEIIGMLPGFLKRRGLIRLFGSPLRGTMTAYLGPIGPFLPQEDESVPELLQACASFARGALRVQYMQFTLSRPPGGINSHFGSGWQDEFSGSYCLDLTGGSDTLWMSLKPRARRGIRKSQQLGIEIVPVHDPDLYYDMQVETFARSGVIPTFSKAFYRAIFDTLIPQGLVSVWGAQYAGRIIASGLFLHDDRETYYVSGGSLTEYRSVPTSYLIHWHAIDSSIKAGRQRYDFGGRGIASIDEFKEAFGPEAIDYWSMNWAPVQVRLAKNAFLGILPYLRRAQRQLKKERS